MNAIMHLPYLNLYIRTDDSLVTPSTITNIAQASGPLLEFSLQRPALLQNKDKTVAEKANGKSG